MKYYCHFTDAEIDALRNFDFMLLLGVLFFLLSNSTVFHTIHVLLLIHISLKFNRLPLCLFLPQWVSRIILIQGSKIAKKR